MPAQHQEIAQFYKNNHDMLADAVAFFFSPPNVITRTSPANYASTKFDFSFLADLHSAHETRQAKKSCRMQQNVIPECVSQKQEILRAFNVILKRNKEQRLGSGLHQKVNYGSLPSTAGNSANAKLAVTERTKQVRCPLT